MAHCPLTKTNDITLVKKIKASRVISLYRMYGLDVTETLTNIEWIYRYKSNRTGYSFYYPFNIEGDARLYEELQKNDWYYKEEKWEHNKALGSLSANERLLEIGCGEGSFLAAVKKKGGPEPIGLELNAKAVAKAVSLGLKVYNQDIKIFAEENRNAFDVVCLFQVLEHIADPITFLTHVLHTIKHNGKLIVAVPNNDSLINKDEDNALNLPPHHMGLWNEKSLQSLADILKLRQKAIWKEPLQEEHFEWYTRIRLKQIFGNRVYSRLISQTAIPKIFKKNLRDRAAVIDGHTILVIYEK